MNNSFDFSYFVPTPDTTANCALSRWNDGLMNLSDFIKSYMGTRQSLEFGFSRNLNIKELLNLGLNSVVDEDGKNDYVINYRKFGDIKAYVCGFEINVVDKLRPFIYRTFNYTKNNSTQKIIFNDNNPSFVCHFFNYKSNYTQEQRISVTLSILNNLKHDIEYVMSDSEIKTYFIYNRSSMVSTIETFINQITDANQIKKDFCFGFGSKEDIENLSTQELLEFNNFNYLDPLSNMDNTTTTLFKDFIYSSYYKTSYYFSDEFYFNFNFNNNYKNIVDKYFHKNGIELVFCDSTYKYPKLINKFNEKFSESGHYYGHVMLRFLFLLKEKQTVTPFLSHDGTTVPLSEQNITIKYTYQTNRSVGTIGQGGAYGVWDVDEECPVYYDGEGNPHPMTLENNIDGMGGRDYTFWSSPVQKTEDGYQFECCMPLAFYNEATGSFGNEYYATKPHEGIEVGQVMYRVPVVKRMRQNIEEAIVNTHLTKCLNDLTPANDENYQNEDTVVLGGVVIDDFTEGLYPIAETQSIASETEYGEVKIVKIKDSEGEPNDVIDLMYHYSETGELSYNDMTMPETGRAIDMITLFDTLNSVSTGNNITENNKLVDSSTFLDLSDRVVTTHISGSTTTGEEQWVYGYKNFVDGIKIGKEPNDPMQGLGLIRGSWQSTSEGVRRNLIISTEPDDAFISLINDDGSNYTEIVLHSSIFNTYVYDAFNFILYDNTKLIIKDSNENEIFILEDGGQDTTVNPTVEYGNLCTLQNMESVTIRLSSLGGDGFLVESDTLKGFQIFKDTINNSTSCSIFVNDLILNSEDIHTGNDFVRFTTTLKKDEGEFVIQDTDVLEMLRIHDKTTQGKWKIDCMADEFNFIANRKDDESNNEIPIIIESNSEGRTESSQGENDSYNGHKSRIMLNCDDDSEIESRKHLGWIKMDVFDDDSYAAVNLTLGNYTNNYFGASLTMINSDNTPGTFMISGNVSLLGNLNLYGDVFPNDNIKIGDLSHKLSSIYSTKFFGDLQGTLTPNGDSIPTQNNNVDLGSNTKRFRNIYATNFDGIVCSLYNNANTAGGLFVINVHVSVSVSTSSDRWCWIERGSTINNQQVIPQGTVGVDYEEYEVTIICNEISSPVANSKRFTLLQEARLKVAAGNTSSATVDILAILTTA